MRRHRGDVLVLPHLGKLAEQMPQHHVAQLIRSGREAPCEITEEGMGVGSHSQKVRPPRWTGLAARIPVDGHDATRLLGMGK